MNYIQFDTEFNSTQEPDVNPVCMYASDGTEIWTHNDKVAQRRVVEWFTQKVEEGYTFIAHGASAECRFLHACGVPWELIHKARWADTYLLHKQMTNCNNRFQYGRYLKETAWGLRPAVSYPPKTNPALNVGVDNTEVKSNYVQVVYNLCGVVVDSKRKDLMRDIIISADVGKIEENKAEILEYCKSDTEHLYPVFKSMWCVYSKYFHSDADAETALLRMGRWSTDIARMECHGIPFNQEKATNLGNNFRTAKESLIQECISVYPFFERDKPTRGTCIGEWVFKYAKFAEYLESTGLHDGWPKTDTGLYSTESKLLEQQSDAVLRTLYETNTSLKQIAWFRPEGAENIFSSVGSDGRIRVFLNPYGTQTGRCAPSPKRGYVFAMASWLRDLIQAPEGYTVVSNDDVGQEVALMGYVSNDQNLLNSYNEGDIYLAFGRLAMMIPPDGTKHSHATERSVCKNIVLGSQYGVGATKLGLQIAMTLHIPPSEVDGRYYLNLHKKAYPDLWAWRARTIRNYRLEGFLMLPDGWILFGDNPSDLSAANFPVQGLGGVLMRGYVAECHDNNIDVICPLHDAIYALSPISCKEDTLAKIEEIMHRVKARWVPSVTIRHDPDFHDHGTEWVEEKGIKSHAKFKHLFAPMETEADRLQLLDSILKEAC